MCRSNRVLWLLVLCACSLPALTMAADPNLIAQYWFDDGEGSQVWDETGNGRHGSFNGAVSWFGQGVIGGALQFSGGTVDISSNVENLSFGDVDLSVTAWIQTSSQGGCFVSKVTNEAGNSFAFGVGMNGEDDLPVVLNRNRANIKAKTSVTDNEWHHLAFVQDYQEEGGGEFWSMYVNGLVETQQLTDILRDNGMDGMFLGRAQDYLPNNWSGLLDELYIYGSVLDDADMPYVMDGATWKPRARDLMPVDGTVLSGTTVELSWSAGWADTALGEHLAPDAHRVYLSTDVNAVTEGREEALLDTITETSYSVADLVPNATYFWRIDEVNESDPDGLWTGKVFSFSVPDLAAKNPSPSDDAKFQSLTVELSWTPGIGATSHVVYLGNTYDDVANADSGGVTVNEPAYAPPGLQADKVYYWRVDEINGSAIKGPVWKFSTVPVADGDYIDPNLIAWWKMNEGEGSTVVDYSGYGRHASFVNASSTRTPQWDDGIFGGAVRVWDGDGLGYIDIPGIPDFNSPEITMCGWVHLEDLPGGWGYPFFTVPTLGSDQASIFFVGGNMRLSWPTGNYKWVHGWDIDSGLAFPVGEWFFVGASVKPDGADYYVNNATFHREATFVPLVTIDQGANLGRAKAKQPWQTVRGRVDDWRLYAKALSADELAEVMRGEPWLAWNPQPGNGVVTDIERASGLSWSAGDGAVAHNVFVALDADTLRNADDTDTTGVYRGQYTETVYALEGVQADMTYYWRIDEVQADGSVRKGNPWKFTTAAYLIIDNFNDYSGEPGMEVYQGWIDGYADPALGGSYTGHADPPYVEKSISSSPSLPLYYNNDGATFTHEDGTTSTPTFSEVKHLLEGNERNWTRHSVETLSISYHGVEAGAEDDTTGNIPDRFYVAIEDGSGKVAVFDHPDNPNAVTRAAWEPAFVIALADIAALGVDLTDIASITFGVGQPGGPAGGVGVLYIDDVLLYPPMPDDPNDPDIPEVPAPADVNIPSLGMEKPAIDGEVDSLWSASTGLPIDTLRSGARDSAADCSGHWRVLWDVDNLYVLIDVKDDVLIQDSSQGWHDDRIELFIDADNGKTAGNESGNDYQYNFSWDPANVPPLEWYFRNDAKDSLAGVDSAVAVIEGGYRIEIKLPWSTLLGSSPQAGDRIGIALGVADDDDGGNSDCAVSSLLGEGGPHSTDLWGTAELLE